jgi:hypothetical protein
MAAKILLLLGLAAGALALSGGTAHAESAAGGSGTGPGPFDPLNPPDDIKKLILTAVQSGNPALMRSTADQLAKLGYVQQANALIAAAFRNRGRASRSAQARGGFAGGSRCRCPARGAL